MGILFLIGAAGIHAQEAGEHPTPSTPHGDRRVELPDHVLEILPQARLIESSADAASQPVTVTVVLSYADRVGFDAFVEALNNQPAQDRLFLSPTEIADRFGPTQASYDAVLAYLTTSGFALTEGSANRLTITVVGTRENAERAFDVPLRDYQLGDVVFFANDSNPRVPTEIAGAIQSIVGLNNLSRPRPRGATAPAP